MGKREKEEEEMRSGKDCIVGFLTSRVWGVNWGVDWGIDKRIVLYF